MAGPKKSIKIEILICLDESTSIIVQILQLNIKVLYFIYNLQNKPITVILLACLKLEIIKHLIHKKK